MDWNDLIKFVVSIAGSSIVIVKLLDIHSKKMREDRERKCNKIKGWREYIDNIPGWNVDASFQDTSVYSELKPFLSTEATEKIERPRNLLTAKPRPGLGARKISDKQLLLDAITRIERDIWKLV